MPPLGLARCETGLQADTQAAAALPDSPGGQRSEEGGGNLGMVARLHPFLPVLCLVHVRHVLLVLSRFNCRVLASLEQQTK